MFTAKNVEISWKESILSFYVVRHQMQVCNNNQTWVGRSHLLVCGHGSDFCRNRFLGDTLWRRHLDLLVRILNPLDARKKCSEKIQWIFWIGWYICLIFKKVEDVGFFAHRLQNVSMSVLFPTRGSEASWPAWRSSRGTRRKAVDYVCIGIYMLCRASMVFTLWKC